ncbi:hypothetical protein Unana1_08521 [Umbelopsis nana]
MGDAGFFKGTSADQDTRFSNKQKKLLKSMKFPPEFDQKVDFSKVNLTVLKPWIATEITKLLGLEDDIVIEFAIGLLEVQNPDPKEMQINLTCFLEGKTQEFLLNLWKLLLSAQESVGGIPASFLEAKKEQIRQQQLKDEEAKRQQKDIMDNIRKRRNAEDEDRRNARDQRDQRGRGREGNRERYDDDRSVRRRGDGHGYDRRARSRSRSRDRSYRSDRYRGDRHERKRDDSEDRYRSSRRRSRTPDRRRSRYSPSRSRSISPRSRRPRPDEERPADVDMDSNTHDLRAKAMASMQPRED